MSVNIQGCESLHVEDPFKVTTGKRKQDFFIGDSSTTETVGEGDWVLASSYSLTHISDYNVNALVKCEVVNMYNQ